MQNFDDDQEMNQNIEIEKSDRSVGENQISKFYEKSYKLTKKVDDF